MILYKATLLSLFLLYSCSGQQDFYCGCVYDGQTKKPLAKVLVKENLPANAKSTYTDANGYFKIENKDQSFTDLIFSIKKYRVDTIPSTWSQHGERLEHTFLDSKPDTIFLMPKDKF